MMQHDDFRNIYLFLRKILFVSILQKKIKCILYFFWREFLLIFVSSDVYLNCAHGLLDRAVPACAKMWSISLELYIIQQDFKPGNGLFILWPL
jgi:hypothetical protein